MEVYKKLTTNILYIDRAALICYVKMHGVRTDFSHTIAQHNAACGTVNLKCDRGGE